MINTGLSEMCRNVPVLLILRIRLCVRLLPPFVLVRVVFDEFQQLLLPLLADIFGDDEAVTVPMPVVRLTTGDACRVSVAMGQPALSDLYNMSAHGMGMNTVSGTYNRSAAPVSAVDNDVPRSQSSSKSC